MKLLGHTMNLLKPSLQMNTSIFEVLAADEKLLTRLIDTFYHKTLKISVVLPSASQMCLSRQKNKRTKLETDVQ